MAGFNIPGIFKMVQGVPPGPRYGPAPGAPPAAPPPGFHVMPDGSLMPDSQMGGYLNGGNIPGYDGITASDFVSDDSMSPGGGGIDVPPADTGAADPNSAYYYEIADKYGFYDDAGNPDLERARELFKSNPTLFTGEEDGGDGSSLAGTYAQIAESARQFNEQMAYDRERAAQEDKVGRWTAEVNRQQAMQDFYNARDAAKLQRKAMFNDAATQAMSAHQAGLGQANIPGIENWRLAGGPQSDAIISGAPNIGFNPALAMGKQISEPMEAPEMNIPGVNF